MTDLKELADEVYSDLDKHDLDCFVVHLAPGMIEHEKAPLPEAAPGAQGVRQWFEYLFAAFPDMRFELQDFVGQDEKGVARVRMHGTHEGSDFLGLPQSGKQVDVEFIDTVRVEDGVVAEHWGISQDLKMMQQLGAVPD